MLHWPDQLMAYFAPEKTLFSSDIFGQHFSSELLFDENVDMDELLKEALKYYANIVVPYSKKAVSKLKELKELNIPIEIIAPAHGIVWKNNPNLILEKYEKWANNYQENQITIIYDTMYGSTRKMAEAITEGIRNIDNTSTIKLFNTANTDSSDIIMEIFRSKALLVGSPTYNSGILNSVAAIMEELKGIKLQNKKAATFSSFGWAPAATKVLSKLLEEANFSLMEPSATINVNWNPTKDVVKKCIEFGEQFADFIK